MDGENGHASRKESRVLMVLMVLIAQKAVMGCVAKVASHDWPVNEAVAPV